MQAGRANIHRLHIWQFTSSSSRALVRTIYRPPSSGRPLHVSTLDPDRHQRSLMTRPPQTKKARHHKQGNEEQGSSEIGNDKPVAWSDPLSSHRAQRSARSAWPFRVRLLRQHLTYPLQTQLCRDCLYADADADFITASSACVAPQTPCLLPDLQGREGYNPA